MDDERPMGLVISPRRCLICEKFCELGEFGLHVFTEHSEQQIIDQWPGGVIGLIEYLEESVQKTLTEIEEQVDLEKMPDDQKLHIEMLRAVLKQMREVARLWKLSKEGL